MTIPTSCPACLQGLQGLSRYSNDAGGVDADCTVVKISKQVLRDNWMPDDAQRANGRGIGRLLR